MNHKRQSSKTIFLIYLFVAVLGYFIFPLPKVQQLIPFAELDTMAIPNEKVAISERAILSYKNAEILERPSYLVCSIDDDPGGTNAFGIYDPTDLAVTVNNLIRLNTKHLFLGTHLHWPDLPIQENNTLSSQLELLDSCILSTPLRRSAESVDMPEYLLDSSVAISEVNGNAQTLPRVNNLSLAPTLKIPSNCKVGFSQLESELTTNNIPLLAVWGDRVVLSSLLLERMHHLKLSPADLQIHIGKFISLGNTGNVVPIDEFGYFSPVGFPEVVEPHLISAEITSIEESPVNTSNAVLTASGVRADSYRAIESPVKQLTQLTLTPVFVDQVQYQRIGWWFELLLAVLIALILSFAAKRSAWVYVLCSMVIGVGLVMGSISLSKQTTYYSPITYLLLALIICVMVSPFLKLRAKSSHKIIDNQDEDDFDDLPSLFKEETFAEKEKTDTKLTARERKRLRHKKQ